TFDINTLQILRMEDFIRSKIEGWDSGLFEMITTVRIAHPEMNNYQFYKSEIEGLVEKHRNEEYYQKFVKYYANNNSHIIELYTPGKYLMKINPAKIAKVINPCDGISNALCIISDNLNKNDILKTHISNILDLYHKAQIEMANPLHKITGTIGNETEKLGDTPDCPDDDSPF
ncbi:MAG: hypothetical protein KA998_01660, partial [Rickettsiaceae bacterium]|nr:hypothetical protein [Rickettsiaceae bacterium]